MSQESQRPVGGGRVASIDVLRGVIMILMVVDHVRLYLTRADFDPTNLAHTTAPLFLTRWITHFCAPGFVFLAGVGAFLRQRKAGRTSVAKFLVVRGLWLILLELTIVRFAWTFNFDYRHYVLAGILWMIGWTMIGLAALVFLPPTAIAAFGVIVVFGHNAVDFLLAAHPGLVPEGLAAAPWQLLYFGGPIEFGRDGLTLAVLYSFVPWIGVIALGYAFGRVLTSPDRKRRRACLAIGGGAVLLFLLLRGGNVYGNPSPWKPQASAAFTVLAFLNTRKYPASLLFLLMTLGPTILAVPLAERARGRVGDFLRVFGGRLSSSTFFTSRRRTFSRSRSPPQGPAPRRPGSSATTPGCPAHIRRVTDTAFPPSGSRRRSWSPSSTFPAGHSPPGRPAIPAAGAACSETPPRRGPGPETHVPPGTDVALFPAPEKEREGP